ncbi:uncharacterized protein LOC135161598 isoform X2 [Diachasmimorpha longicaudata]
MVMRNIITTLESKMNIFEKDQQNEVRTICVDVISNFMRQDRLPRYPELMEKIRSAKTFKKSHPEIVFLKADKGNVTVAVNRQQYIAKMSDLLSDSSTYTVIKNDPTPTIQRKVNRLVLNWYNNGFITEADKCRLWSRYAKIALSYGQPKIHKKDVPYRMIVSFMGTPTYSLAKYVQKILTDCMKEEVKLTRNKTSIINSFTLVKKIRSLNLPDDFEMISMDAVSLFTNIPIVLVIAGIKKRWKWIQKYTKITQDSFIDAVSLCVNASTFQFNNIKYQQIFGAAMGSPLSPIVAEIVLQDLENFCIKKLDFPVYFYTRYVDDVLAFVPKDKVNSILSCFNSYHKRLQFTLEREENSKINFLEVTLIKSTGKIDLDWYRKPTSSGRYLNYYSHHSKGHKISTICNLVDRAILLANVEFHLKNLFFIKRALIENGYPRSLILKTVRRRHSLLLYSNRGYSEGFYRSKRVKQEKLVALPYVQGLSETLKSHLRKFDISLSFKSDSSLRWLFTGHKDRWPHGQLVNTVYKISCLECEFIFIDHTKRPLGMRMKDHYQSLRQPHNFQDSNPLTEHAFQYLHDFDFERVEVLAIEKNYKKRELLSLMFKEVEFPEADESVDRISHVSNIYSSLFHS